MYLDLSKVTVKSGASEDATINCDNWKVMVCKATGKKWSDFTVTKGKMVERTSNTSTSSSHEESV